MMRAPKSLKYQLLVLLLVLFTAVGLYQGAIQIWGGGISVSITDVFGTSTGVYVIVLCLLSYLLRGQRWLIWVKTGPYNMACWNASLFKRVHVYAHAW